MRHKYILFIFFTLFIVGFSQQADEDYLIRENWIATVGYEDGEVSGEHNCHFFEDGLEFKEDEVVYNASFDFDFNYSLSDRDKVTQITFLSDMAGEFLYKIHVISENEM